MPQAAFTLLEVVYSNGGAGVGGGGGKKGRSTHLRCSWEKLYPDQD